MTLSFFHISKPDFEFKVKIFSLDQSKTLIPKRISAEQSKLLCVTLKIQSKTLGSKRISAEQSNLLCMTVKIQSKTLGTKRITSGAEEITLISFGWTKQCFGDKEDYLGSRGNCFDLLWSPLKIQSKLSRVFNIISRIYNQFWKNDDYFAK